MNLIYDHWYKCSEGIMPENFEECMGVLPNTTKEVLVAYKEEKFEGSIHKAFRNKTITPYFDFLVWVWIGEGEHEILAWKIPQPYKE